MLKLKSVLPIFLLAGCTSNNICLLKAFDSRGSIGPIIVTKNGLPVAKAEFVDRKNGVCKGSGIEADIVKATPKGVDWPKNKPI